MFDQHTRKEKQIYRLSDHLSAKRVKEIRDLTFTSMKPERSIEPMMSMMVPTTNKLMASMIDLYGMRTFGFSN